MSALHKRLARAFEDGHRIPVPDLLTDERFQNAGQTAEAAVLIAVRDRPENDGGASVILTQRPTTMRDHPGQVAFPGGKLEPGEDAIAAALREAEEELALDSTQPRIIGTTDLYYTGTGFIVTPVLATLPPDVTLVPNAREVESWFEVPLALLLNQDAWIRRSAMWQGMRREYLEMGYDGYRIWGVTAAICYNLSRRLRLNDGADG